MNKITRKAMTAISLLLLTAAGVQAAPSWQDVIKAANYRVHTREVCSVLGTCVAWDVAHIKASNEANKRQNQFKTKNQKNTDLLVQYETNLQILQSTLKNNDLFGGYILTAVNEELFANLTTEQVADLQTFLQGKGSAELKKYSKDGYTHFSVKLASVELDVCPEIKVITVQKLFFKALKKSWKVNGEVLRDNH